MLPWINSAWRTQLVGLSLGSVLVTCYSTVNIQCSTSVVVAMFALVAAASLVITHTAAAAAAITTILFYLKHSARDRKCLVSR